MTIPPGLGVPGPGGMPIPSGVPIPADLVGQSLLTGLTPPDYATLSAPPAGALDAQGHFQMAWMRSESERIFQTLRAALRPAQRDRVATVPFHVTTDPREPNAAAGCTPGARSPLVFITSGMLVLAAGAAEARAYDELAGTSHYETYAGHVVHWLRHGQAVGPVPDGLLTGPLASDPRRLARQHHLWVQQIAFILGHELAHHYRGHTGCIPGATPSRADLEAIQRGLADSIPTFEQPNEVEADVWGTANVLEAGRERSGGAWSAEGALLNLDVFRHLSRLAGGDISMVFMSTHPPSELRGPIVQMAARQFRPGQDPLPTASLGAGGGIDIDLGGGAPIHLPIPLPPH